MSFSRASLGAGLIVTLFGVAALSSIHSLSREASAETSLASDRRLARADQADPAVQRGQAGRPAHPNYGRSVLTDGESFHVTYKPRPSKIPNNELFVLEITVHDGLDPSKRIDDAEVSVNARMPAHGHGMNVRPAVEPNGRGGWNVSGMLFHMSGHWQMVVAVTLGGRTERAGFDVLLD